MRIAVLGYASDAYGVWDPSYTSKGLPGSEECAVYATNTLAQMGHEVTLYMNPPSASSYSSPDSNPRWIHVNQWDNPTHTNEYELVLMWRRYDVTSGRKRGKVVFFWPHDSPYHQLNFPTFPSFDGICILSQHHWNQFKRFPGFADIPYTISGNGLLPQQFVNPKQFTNPYSIGYFSNYARGLINLLFLWPVIKDKFPLATLDIYYGRDTWGLLSPDKLASLVKMIEEYSSLGVRERGMVGHEQLAQAMKETSIWAYPCNDYGIAETFCITAVKCQAAGCIPVTSRIGALDETVHPEAPSLARISSPIDIFRYRDLLFDTLNKVESIDRQKYIDYGNQYTWERCVTRWLQLYEKVGRKNGC